MAQVAHRKTRAHPILMPGKGLTLTGGFPWYSLVLSRIDLFFLFSFWVFRVRSTLPWQVTRPPDPVTALHWFHPCMDSEGLAEEAALSASDSIAPAPLVAAKEAAESADDLAGAGADRGNWADLSEAPEPEPPWGAAHCRGRSSLWRFIYSSWRGTLLGAGTPGPSRQNWAGRARTYEDILASLEEAAVTEEAAASQRTCCWPAIQRASGRSNRLWRGKGWTWFFFGIWTCRSSIRRSSGRSQHPRWRGVAASCEAFWNC